MGQQIVLQPGGLYAVWSTVVDEFVATDLTRVDLEDWFVDNATEEVYREVERVISALNRGEKPYLQFTLTWDEIQRDRREAGR